MSGLGPHRIPHDHKHASRGNFERKGEAKGVRGVLSDDGSDTLVGSSKASNFGSRKSSKGKSGPQKLRKDNDYIPKSVLVADWINEQKPRRRLRWWILLLVVILILAIVIPVVVIKVQSGTDIGSGPANSTATVFVSLGITTTATSTTTASATVVTTQTLVPMLSSTVNPVTLASPSSAPTPVIPSEGFYARSFSNGGLQIIYADGRGNIMSVQNVAGIWSNPATIATDAAIGSTVSVIFFYFHNSEDDDISATCMDSVEWNVYYVDKYNILQTRYMEINLDLGDNDFCSSTDTIELSALAGPASGYGWVLGTLGSSNYKVGPSLYQSACAYSNSFTLDFSTGSINYSPNDATVYIYYDSSGGNVTKIGAFNNGNAWYVVRDMPKMVTANSRAIDCTARTDGIESVWVATQTDTIQQWWTNTNVSASSSNQTGTWNPGLTYNGSIQANTSIHSLSTPNLSIVYFQAANNSIMQLTFTTSLGLASSPTYGMSEVALALPGTKLWTSGGENPSDTFFYLYFQNGTGLVQMYMQMDSVSGSVTGGGAPAGQSTGTLTIPSVSFYAGAVHLGVEWTWEMLCLVAIWYLVL